MATFVLTHSHDPSDCRRAFAAWNGFESPLSHKPTLNSCVEGGHRAWWKVEAIDPGAALAQLPPFVAERTEVEAAREVTVP